MLPAMWDSTAHSVVVLLLWSTLLPERWTRKCHVSHSCSDFPCFFHLLDTTTVGKISKKCRKWDQNQKWPSGGSVRGPRAGGSWPGGHRWAYFMWSTIIYHTAVIHFIMILCLGPCSIKAVWSWPGRWRVPCGTKSRYMRDSPGWMPNMGKFYGAFTIGQGRDVSSFLTHQFLTAPNRSS